MHAPLSALVTALLCAPLSSQVFEETFSYPDGPIIPGWTQHRGVWTVRNQRIASTSGSLWAYITRDGLTAKDSVLDGEVFVSGTALQFAGVTSRHAGTNLDNNLVMCKAQGSGVFNTAWIYERAIGAAVSRSGVFSVPTARVRLITLDNTARMLMDIDGDGSFELDIGTKTLTTVLGSGLVGMTAYGAAELDNFKYYDAVLVGAPASTPRIGTTYTMQLRAPQPQNTVFFCAASLKNTGIPIDTRKLPLSVDALLQLSLTTPSVFGTTT